MIALLLEERLEEKRRNSKERNNMQEISSFVMRISMVILLQDILYDGTRSARLSCLARLGSLILSSSSLDG